MAKDANLIDQTKLSYDFQGDVLYISFGEPQPADDSDITDEGVVVRLREGRIVGLTVLNAKKRVVQPQGCIALPYFEALVGSKSPDFAHARGNLWFPSSHAKLPVTT